MIDMLALSHQARRNQDVPQDRFFDGRKDYVHVCRVRRTRQKRIDGKPSPVEPQEPIPDELGCSLIVHSAGVVWKVLRKGTRAKLLPEDVCLVQKEDNRGMVEPARIHNVVEELKGLNESILARIFGQQLVIFAQGNAEDDCCGVFKDLHPATALSALPAHVKHVDAKHA